MKKRLFAGLLAGVLAVGMLTGCGGSSQSAASSAAPETEAESAAAEAGRSDPHPRSARERDAHEAPLPVLARGRPGRGGALCRVFVHVGRGFYQTALSNSTRPSGRGARG